MCIDITRKMSLQATQRMVHYSPFKFDEFELRWSAKIGALVSYVGAIGAAEWFAAVSASPYSRDQYLEYGGITHNGRATSYIREMQPGTLERLFATELYRYEVDCIDGPHGHEQLVHDIEYVCYEPPVMVSREYVAAPIERLLRAADVMIFKYGDAFEN
ncbi:hypothetical protein F-M6_0288 [Faustovirus]|nr:hypothetical protein F-M6_0288 [Faustovirus]